MCWEYVIPRRGRTGLGEVKVADMVTKYFVEAVRREVASRYGEDTLYGGGLRIYTTLDFDMQAAAWNAVSSTLDQPGDPAAAVVAVDEYGQVKAMVGGRDFDADQVNLAMGRSEEHTSELQSLMRISYAVFCLQQKIKQEHI